MATKTSADAPAQEGATSRLEILPSRQFPEWLAERGGSLAFTTREAGKLFFIGLQPNGRLLIGERSFGWCTGLASDGNALWLASLYQLWRFENVLGQKERHRGFDRLYVPRLGYTTGEIEIHDIAIEEEGRPVFISALFSCLATVSQTHSFKPVWRPGFITALAAEDRCHLNGLAMAAGAPAYASALSDTDSAGGWRDKRRDGGVLINVNSNQVVARGLSLPHSPRVYSGALWVLNSGSGEIGRCDLKSGRFEPVAFCPGYLRGFALIDRFAVLGLSHARENRPFAGLPIKDNLKRRKAESRCGLVVVDLKSGEVVHTLDIRGMVREINDVAFLPGVARPMALGFKTDEIRRVLTLEAEDPA